METPPIQYARTEDGLDIADCVFGEGPLVIPIEIASQSHVALEWEAPAIRRFHEALAKHFLVARYNARCSPLSDCGDELNMETMAEDVRAVIEATGRAQAAVVTMGPGLMYGMAAALIYPEHVSPPPRRKVRQRHLQQRRHGVVRHGHRLAAQRSRCGLRPRRRGPRPPRR